MSLENCFDDLSRERSAHSACSYFLVQVFVHKIRIFVGGRVVLMDNRFKQGRESSHWEAVADFVRQSKMCENEVVFDQEGVDGVCAVGGNEPIQDFVVF